MDKKIRLVKLNRQRKFDKFASLIRLGILLFFVMANVSANALNSNIGETRESKALVNGVAIADNSTNQQQNRKVTGKVTDSKGATLPGVSVVVKGTTTGTITDANGAYSLSNISDKSVLEFSFVGMKKVDIVVGNKAAVNVSLEDETIGLESVVVVGYGTQKKVNLTGSVSSVDSKEIEARPVSNVGQALQGIVPGLDISPNNGGYLNGGPAMNIRGIATIGNSNGGPLVLIDGMEGDMNSLNPRDIENISILKDAAASSIYGSRAPFGVILITTKKGKQGKMEVSINSDFRWNTPLHLAKQVNGYDFMVFSNQAMENMGTAGYFPATAVERVKDVVNGKSNVTMIVDPLNANGWDASFQNFTANNNWNKIIYKDWAPSQDHSISLRGGSEKMSYYISGDYLDQTGIVKLGGDSRQRYNLTAKIDANLSKWATLSYNGKFTRSNYSAPSYLNDYQAFGNRAGYNNWSIMPQYDPNGFLYRTDNGSVLMLVDGGRQNEENDILSQQLNLTLEPIKNWKIFANLNFRINDNLRHDENLPTYRHNVDKSLQAVTTDNWVSESSWRENYINPNIYSEYSKSVDNNNFKIMAGFQSESLMDRYLSASKRGILLLSKPVIDNTSGLGADGLAYPNGASGNKNQWKVMGYFGRFNYDYNGRYLAEVNIRYDGTSRYLSANRWKTFPSFSVGWNVAKEPFFSGLTKYVNTLKFRGSFGDVGNQNLINPDGSTNFYPFYQTMPFSSVTGNWLINGAKTNQSWLPGLVNPGITWETVRTYNGGVDIDMFNSRFSATLDVFNRYTLNSTGPSTQVPVILGTSLPSANNTDIKTYGFELSVTWKDQLANGLAYSVHALLSDNQTIVTRYNNVTGDLGWWGSPSYRQGAKIGEIWGYQTIGIAQTDKQMADYLATLPNGAQNAIGSGANWKAGDIMYKDLNGDGKVDGGSNTISDHGDQKVIGNRTPRYRVGLDLNASWKGFDLRAFFQGVLKMDYFNSTQYFWGYDVNNAWNAPWGNLVQEANMDYWRDANNVLGANPNGYFPRPLGGDNKNNQVQSRYLQNAAYVRLKNLQIGYTLPEKLTSKVMIKKLRVYVSGENLATWTKMTDLFDPELISAGQQWWNPGSTYPLSKVISVGVNINF